MSERNNDRLDRCLVLLMAAGGTMGLIGNIAYDYVINRKKKFRFGPNLWKENAISSGEFMRTDLSEQTLEWAEKTPISQMDISAFDGTPLHSYCFRQKKDSRRWLIAVHGYGQAAASMFPYAKPFYEAGFNTLLPECRGYGRSGGQCFGMGWLDRMDVIKWIYAINAMDPRAEIVLYGVSTGADAVMMAAGEELPKNVRCVIEDSGYSSLVKLSNYLTKKRGVPAFPLTFSVSLVTTLRAGYSFADASAVNQVAKSNTPILFIHGGNDEMFPTEMVYELYNAANCSKDLMVIPNAKHGYGMFADYDGYWKKVWKFIDSYCPVPEGEKTYRERLTEQLARIRGK